MKVAIDIEADALVDPKNIWLIVCKDIDTDEYYIFREVTHNEEELQRFRLFAGSVSTWIGHNWLGYDWPVLERLDVLKIGDVVAHSVDTLIISKLVDYSRIGHSIEAYGIEFGVPKGKNHYLDFFKQWSQELEDYCVRDVDICHKIYLKYLDTINDPLWHSSINLEHSFQLIVNQLHDNGFSFNTLRATNLLEKVQGELNGLDQEIQASFPSRLRPIREITPRITQHGTLHKGDFRWVEGGDLSEFNGGPFTRCEWAQFNPSSHKQVVDTLHGAGWVPVDKTQTHIETEREINKLKYSKDENKELALIPLRAKLRTLQKYGWKIDEQNLGTLPSGAPAPARTLAKRILLESRRRSLTEWINLVSPDGRVHGTFYGIGAWTHRMAHQRPNTANIPNEFKEDGSRKLLGKELRSLWQAPRNRLLVGVDAEGIQLRIFAHYIDDQEFTDALVHGSKTNKTDPHSLNQRVLGSVCRTRQAAKRFVYALLLGGGIPKLAQILECSRDQAEEALSNLLQRYTGFARLKETTIRADAKRGWFTGLDGRRVKLPGQTEGERRHLCMSGYLQNGEAIVMKKATLRWHNELRMEGALLVNLVHDEWQTETPNNVELAIRIANRQAESLRLVGEELGLKFH
jgi:DNA polymerase-1